MKNQLTIAATLTLLLPGVAMAQSARDAVVAAEIAFAEQATQAGTGTAFIANSAPNAVVTEDGKWANAQDVWKGRTGKSSSRLAWYPVLADASQTGDLGYTTGPWTAYKNGQPGATGEYVTVWRKQPDGKFKFVVDMGIERIGVAPSKSASVPAPRLMAAAATPSAAPSNVLLDLDAKFSAAELLKPGTTYQQYLSAEARLYRPGQSMMQGEAASANMKIVDGRYFFAATGGYLAAAGDLGYVVGTVRQEATAKHPEQNGTYLRIWRREAVAGWRLAIEVFNFAAAPRDQQSASTPVPEGAIPGLLPTKRGQ